MQNYDFYFISPNLLRFLSLLTDNYSVYNHIVAPNQGFQCAATGSVGVSPAADADAKYKKGDTLPTIMLKLR